MTVATVMVYVDPAQQAEEQVRVAPVSGDEVRFLDDRRLRVCGRAELRRRRRDHSRNHAAGPQANEDRPGRKGEVVSGHRR